MATIEIGVGVIDALAAALRLIRADVPDVSAGINPQDASHVHGFPLSGITLKAGSNMPAGTGVATRAAGLGAQLDLKLTALDTKLSTYQQNLIYLRDKAEETEFLNMGAAETVGRLTNTGTTA